VDDEEEMLYGDSNASAASAREEMGRGAGASALSGSEGGPGKAEPTHWCLIIRDNGVMEVRWILVFCHNHFGIIIFRHENIRTPFCLHLINSFWVFLVLAQSQFLHLALSFCFMAGASIRGSVCSGHYDLIPMRKEAPLPLPGKHVVHLSFDVMNPAYPLTVDSHTVGFPFSLFQFVALSISAFTGSNV